ncbi:serine hydrolase-like protein 2 [Galleria mellonella]|uniref:Serine hydrolase-like protein 2 n=1 Tax=Galleria mellonella TaxID=7137 RepID=A0ABM3MRU1_GALME|nr:serine hydrolase-like protein 2 [Galleria mellonella]
MYCTVIAWGDCFDPPVLMCHGQVDSAACFRPLVKLLPRNYYYIAMELPGNGKSDPVPPGLMMSAYEILYAIKTVVDHFRWDSFIYIAHSLGTLLGKLYSLSFPGRISHIIDLDPTAAYHTVSPEQLPAWYRQFFVSYFEKYKKFVSPKENAPKYTYEKAFEMMKKNRGLTDDATRTALERILEPAGKGLVRFTFDQRAKLITLPPLPPAYLKALYTSIATPTLSILAEDSVQNGAYKMADFVFVDDCERQYYVKRVLGNHDVHVNYPERIAPHIIHFLLNSENSTSGSCHCGHACHCITSWFVDKRPDGMSLVPWRMGRPLVWDFSYVDTVAPSHLASTGCRKRAGVAATHHKTIKHRKYSSLGNGKLCSIWS